MKQMCVYIYTCTYLCNWIIKKKRQVGGKWKYHWQSEGYGLRQEKVTERGRTLKGVQGEDKKLKLCIMKWDRQTPGGNMPKATSKEIRCRNYVPWGLSEAPLSQRRLEGKVQWQSSSLAHNSQRWKLSSSFPHSCSLLLPLALHWLCCLLDPTIRILYSLKGQKTNPATRRAFCQGEPKVWQTEERGKGGEGNRVGAGRRKTFPFWCWTDVRLTLQSYVNPSWGKEGYRDGDRRLR